MKQSVLEYNTWDDVVFQNRNKYYGAYVLRQSYARYILIAACCTIVFFMSALYFSFFKTSDEINYGSSSKPLGGHILKSPPSIKKEIIIIPPASKLKLPAQKMLKFVAPTVTSKVIDDKNPLPSVQDIEQNNTGSENTDGEKNKSTYSANPQIGEVTSSEPVTFAEQMPQFPGGQEALMTYIARHINYPAEAIRMGIEGTVFISFIISKEGKVSDISIMKGLSKECDAEAIRVIQMLPTWKPGKQNGDPVVVRFSLPIRFKLNQ